MTRSLGACQQRSVPVSKISHLSVFCGECFLLRQANHLSLASLPMPTLMWFRRDLRLRDNPALNASIEAAIASGDGRVVPLFIFDESLWGPAGLPRKAYLKSSLTHLNESLDRNLLIMQGEPAEVLTRLIDEHQITSVHVSEDFGPYGRSRDKSVEAALAEFSPMVELTKTGSPYAVSPGRVTKADGSPYRVYTPFYKGWLAHGWRKPAPSASKKFSWWQPEKGVAMPDVSATPEALAAMAEESGEDAAWRRWAAFKKNHLADYDEGRNRPDLDSTSKLSTHLRWGEIHPRSLLAELNDSKSHETFRKELAWREFYADVLFHEPKSSTQSMNQAWESMGWRLTKNDEKALAAWQQGLTGYPFVDAGMRQMLATGWMHNRVRMVVGSFLVKDLHVHWRYGASWFMRNLKDGDLASNSHGWQWVAGSGTDAAPYFRVFNPVTQGLKFDPNGEYVRRWVPELAHLKGSSAHEPWNEADGYQGGYPQRLVDHGEEREETLRRYSESRKSK